VKATSIKGSNAPDYICKGISLRIESCMAIKFLPYNLRDKNVQVKNLTFSYLSELHEESGESQLIPTNSHSLRGQQFIYCTFICPSLRFVLCCDSQWKLFFENAGTRRYADRGYRSRRSLYISIGTYVLNLDCIAERWRLVTFFHG
jgi:hypothetical protein